MTSSAAARRSARQSRPSSQSLSPALMRQAADLRRQSDFRYYVDRGGCQHFNFPQRVWLDPTIAMAVTPVQTIALETLALNLLTFMIRERDYRAAVGVTSQRAVVLSRAFCADCLLGAPPEAWELPRTSIRSWLESHRSAGSARGHRCARRFRHGASR